jgi:nucleotide-binding universal stress UspA family protein
MAWMSSILAPVAFSPRCQGALQYAETLACHFHSELTVIHVVPPPLAPFSAPEAGSYLSTIELTRERVAEAETEIAAYLEEPGPGFQLTREVLTGDPAHEIVRVARERAVDLIVMATHGYGPFRRFLLGSVTAKVLHDAPCPVWTGPHLEHSPSYTELTFRRVLSAVDLGNASKSVLKWAGGFAREFGARLDVVHVLPHTLIQLGGIYFDPEWRMQAVADARNQISRLQEEAGTAGEVLIEFGTPSAAVSALAASRNSDLLVVGRGEGLAGRLRATAYAILRESPCPVAAI